MIVIGLMSGTSADGIDAAVVRLEGAPPELHWELLAHRHTDYDPLLCNEIFACFRPETGTVDRLCALNFALGRAYALAAQEAIAAAGLTADQVDLIGSHGQTLWHIPSGPNASTLQLGEPAVIAEVTGLPVVSNFRVADMAAGGQGAPLVSYVDLLLFTHPTHVRALQNIGGIGNVTFVPPASASAFASASLRGLAFDTGPGNMLIDDAVQRASNGTLAYDDGGNLAAKGRVSDLLLAELLAEPYLRLPPPKTTGRELFGSQYGAQVWQRGLTLGLTANDIIATVTAFTAHSIARAYADFLPQPPDEVIVSGGGAFNRTLLEMLAELLPTSRMLTIADLGLPADAKEAAAFAVLAYETWHGRPGNWPPATGASRPVVLGSITPGRSGARKSVNSEK
jgi:anhydro-N-acetylmuramic acid kinase